VLEAAECRALDRVEAGSAGSISTSQPKRLGSFGSLATSKRLSNLPAGQRLDPAVDLPR
jgi:hypothetical protein